MRAAIALEEKTGLSVRQAGRVTRKSGSKKLYVDFCYNGVRIEKSTGLEDTSANRRKMEQWLIRQNEKIRAGSFVFAEAFPGASEEEKAFHAVREGWDYRPEPHNLLFENYVATWRSTILSKSKSFCKKYDWNLTIDSWLLPYFGQKTFHQIHAVEIQRFISQLKCKQGAKKGQPHSRSRVNNILIPLRAIWSDACEENHWNLPDPFRFVKKHLPTDEKKHPEGFRFDDWMRVARNIDPFYLPHVEIMLMTGMIASEIAGFRKQDIVNGELDIKNSIAKGHEKGELKTRYRKRRLTITSALQERLKVLIDRAEGEYLFTMKNGRKFDNYTFRDCVWIKAFEKSGVGFRPPYSLRHSHAAWGLAIGVPMDRMVARMGHGSRQMIYEVYGKYIPGIEEDMKKIRGYFGKDFA